MSELHPTVADAKALGQKHDLRRCVILFELEDGRVGYSSYGRTKGLCGTTRGIMDEVFDDLEHRIQFDSTLHAKLR